MSSIEIMGLGAMTHTPYIIGSLLLRVQLVGVIDNLYFLCVIYCIANRDCNEVSEHDTTYMSNYEPRRNILWINSLNRLRRKLRD